jgi:pimeloyl-ACP methyl ester carboxylesterase
MSKTQNSTNVRAMTPAAKKADRKSASIEAVKAAMRALTVVSPALTSRWAYHLFTTPQRHERPQREHLRLADAESLDFVWGPHVLRGWSWGQGPVVLLVHGWEGRGAQLGAFVDPLVQAGYRVITFDGPAHGDSPGESITPLELAQSIRGLADWVGGVHAVIAHSMGGLATSLALQAGLQVERAVFVAPGSHPSDAMNQLASALDLPPSVIRGVREALAKRMGYTWQEVANAQPFADHDTPLLIAHDTGDQDVPFAAAQHMQQTWGPAELLVTEGLGHRRILRDSVVVADAVTFIGPPPATAMAPSWQTFLRIDEDLGL